MHRMAATGARANVAAQADRMLSSAPLRAGVLSLAIPNDAEVSLTTR